MQQRRIAVITARGGSKRIPKKNIRDFCGKPILAYSIQAAFASEMFDEVMVSTDSEEIAAVAKTYGASVPFMRSEKASDDYATTDDVLKEVLLEYQDRGEDFDVVVCIYPTAPFVTARKIKNAIDLLEQEEADEVIPVVRFSYPPQRGFIIRDGMLEYEFPQFEKMRSQDLEPIYHDCGQFYVMKSENILQSKTGLKSLPFEISELEVQDIDSESDWTIAEMKYRFMVKSQMEG